MKLGFLTVNRHLETDLLLDLILQAIDYVNRCINNPNFIAENPRKPQVQRKLAFKKEALIWISSCVKTMLLNQPDIVHRIPGVPFVGLGCIGKHVDLIHAMRGHQYGTRIVDTSENSIVDAAIDDIVGELPLLAAFIRHYRNPQTNPQPANQMTSTTALADYFSDIGQLQRLLSYTGAILAPRFLLASPHGREAMLRCLQVIGEVIGQRLSNDGKKYFFRDDIQILSGLRNALDHVNGSNEHYRAASIRSRAARLAQYVEHGQDQLAPLLFEILAFDIPRIHQQATGLLEQYQRCRQPNPAIRGNDAMRSWQKIKDLKASQRIMPQIQTPPLVPRRNPNALSDLNQFMVARTRTPDYTNSQDLILRLRGIQQRAEDQNSWCADAKEILFGNRNARLTPERARGLNILWEKIVYLDENIHYFLISIANIRHANAEIQRYISGDRRHLFGSPRASQRITLIRNAIEFNVVNLSEHAHDIFARAGFFAEAYQRELGVEVREIYVDLIERARNYLSHVGNFAFHLTEGHTDLGLIVRELIPRILELGTDVTNIKAHVDAAAEQFLATVPRYQTQHMRLVL